MTTPPGKRRSREQIVSSLRQPQKPAAAPTQASTTVYRRMRAGTNSARERVGASATRSYRQRHLHPAAQPLPVGIATALFAGGLLAVAGVDLYLIAIAAPVACALAYGAAQATIGTVVRRRSRDELDLAAAFDQLVEGAARELPEATLAQLNRIKALLTGLLAELPDLRESGTLSSDDAFFVRQVVARYVPDAVTPYLAMPAAGRRAGAPAQSAERLLDEQLAMIEEKLAALGQRAQEAQLDRLRRNRSFLERKLR